MDKEGLLGPQILKNGLHDLADVHRKVEIHRKTLRESGERRRQVSVSRR